MARANNEVMLSGGDLGGTIVEGGKWAAGDERDFPAVGRIVTYRRGVTDEDTETAGQAVFVSSRKA